MGEKKRRKTGEKEIEDTRTTRWLKFQNGRLRKAELHGKFSFEVFVDVKVKVQPFFITAIIICVCPENVINNIGFLIHCNQN